MAKSTQYALGRETVRVERVGNTNEYAVIRQNGTVHEHRTFPEDVATRIAVRLSKVPEVA